MSEPSLSPLEGTALVEIEGLLAAAHGARPPLRPWKRLVDVAVAAISSFFALPAVLVAAFLVAVVDRHFPFYTDVRVGMGGRPFRCFKIRTMDADPRILEDYLAEHLAEREIYRKTRKLSFDPRITRVGAFLRKSSIDEFPQLWNVLHGDMSLVGPRPLAPAEFLERGALGLPLTLVRPGLTGLWQTRGRSDLTIRRRIALDNFYAKHCSPALDIGVLLRTPLAVLRGKGAR